MVRKYMQPPPEVERFNENYKLSEVSGQRKSSVFKNTGLKQSALENFTTSKSVGRLLSSTGKTRTTILQSIKNAKFRSERMKIKLPDQSTVKTQDILRLINGVNRL